MPRDTRVSIENEKCRACFSATWWNGHAAQVATGAASATRTHCQPENLVQPKIDSISDRSVSGTKNTSARYSLRRRRRTAAVSAVSAAGSGAPAAGGTASSAE